MPMIEIVAVLGLFLFWASLFWLPTAVARVLGNSGRTRAIAMAAVAAFVLVLLGYTRTMASGSLAEAVAWSLAWALPVGLTAYARTDPQARWRRGDPFVLIAVVLTFVPANLFLIPTVLLLAVRTLVWPWAPAP